MTATAEKTQKAASSAVNGRKGGRPKKCKCDLRVEKLEMLLTGKQKNCGRVSLRCAKCGATTQGIVREAQGMSVVSLQDRIADYLKDGTVSVPSVSAR